MKRRGSAGRWATLRRATCSRATTRNPKRCVRSFLRRMSSAMRWARDGCGGNGRRFEATRSDSILHTGFVHHPDPLVHCAATRVRSLVIESTLCWICWRASEPVARLVPSEGEASGIEATAPAVRKKRSQSAAFVHVESAQRTCVAVGPGRLQVGSDEAIERTARRSLAMDPDGAGFRIPGPSSPRSSPQHPDRAVSMPFLSDH
jgi:hypothetical protein